MNEIIGHGILLHGNTEILNLGQGLLIQGIERKDIIDVQDLVTQAIQIPGPLQIQVKMTEDVYLPYIVRGLDVPVQHLPAQKKMSSTKNI